MTNSEWLDLKAKLLYESGMPLREIRKFFGGVSFQAIQQRLKRIGCGARISVPPKGRDTVYTPWQISFTQKVRDLGFFAHEVDYLLSFPKGTTVRLSCGRKREFRGKHPQDSNFKVNLVRKAWIEARNNILLHARANGATFKEIAELAGFSNLEVALITLKRMSKRSTSSSTHI